MKRGSRWRKSSTVLLYGVVLLCFIAAASIGYARLSGYELLSVQSNSMSPVMHTGDAVLVSRRHAETQLGDIVSFTSPMNPKLVITHRVIGVDNRHGMIETRGDNTSLVDTPIPTSSIIGNTTHVVPKMGYILSLIKNPFGLLVLIYLPAFGIILAEVRRLSNYYATGVNPVKNVHYRLHPGQAYKLQ